MRVVLICALLCCAACGEKIDAADKADVLSYLEETEKDLKQNLDMTRSMCEGTLKGDEVDSRMGEMTRTLESNRQSNLFGKLMESKLPDRIKEKVDRLSVLRSSASLTWGDITMARIKNQPGDESKICGDVAKTESDVRAAITDLRTEMEKP